MKILSIDATDNYFKFSLFDMVDDVLLTHGHLERIGLEGSIISIVYNNQIINQEVDANNYEDASSILIDKLISLDIIKSLFEINGIGHRIVHGKDIFDSSVLISENVMDKLEKLKEEFPNYNGASVDVVRAFKKILPDTLQVAVFDTSFYVNMSDDIYLYPVPYSWYKEYGLRKYGFQGISHRYISREVKKDLGDEYKLISCHLGNKTGSVCAILNGKCVDNSMGFTPLSGLITTTKSGDVDVSIIPYIMEKEGKNASEVIDDLNNCSGLFGISEFSGDLDEIFEKARTNDYKTGIAREKFIRRIVDYIAQYYVLLNGCDVIAFSSDVFIRHVDILKDVCKRLSCLGLVIDNNISEIDKSVVRISSDDSKILVYVVPTDEEFMIAKDTYNLIDR